MACRLTLPIANPDGSGGSLQIEVKETFYEAMNKCHPINQPSSSLEFRQSLTWTSLEGGFQLCVPPGLVSMIEELESEENSES